MSASKLKKSQNKLFSLPGLVSVLGVWAFITAFGYVAGGLLGGEQCRGIQSFRWANGFLIISNGLCFFISMLTVCRRGLNVDVSAWLVTLLNAFAATVIALTANSLGWDTYEAGYIGWFVVMCWAYFMMLGFLLCVLSMTRPYGDSKADDKKAEETVSNYE